MWSRNSLSEFTSLAYIFAYILHKDDCKGGIG
jgi:hypothetical protein